MSAVACSEVFPLVPSPARQFVPEHPSCCEKEQSGSAASHTQNKGHGGFFFPEVAAGMFQLGSGPKRRCCLLQCFPICGKIKAKLFNSESGWILRTETFHAVHKGEWKRFPFSIQNLINSTEHVSKQGNLLALGTPQPTPLQNNPPAFSPAPWGHADPGQRSGLLQWNKASIQHWVLFETLCSGIGAPSIPPHRCQGWPGSPAQLHLPAHR